MADPPFQVADPAEPVEGAERPRSDVEATPVRRWRVPLQGWVVMVLTAAGVIAFGLVWRAAPEPPRTTVTIEFTVPEAGTAMVATADAGVFHERYVALKAGLNRVSIDDVPLPIDWLRFSPVDIPGTEVVLHEMILRQGDRVLLRYGAGDFASWTPYDVDDRSLEGDGYHVRLATAVPGGGLAISVRVDASGSSPTFASRLDDWFSDSWRVLTLALAGPLAILLIAWWWRRPTFALAAGISFLGLLAAGWLIGTTAGVTPASRALGGAGWTGKDASYPAHVLGVAVVITALATALGWFADRVWRARRGRNPPPAAETVGEEIDGPRPGPATSKWPLRSRRWRLAPLVAVPLVYALIRLPSVRSIELGLTGPVGQGWDTENLRTWDLFYAAGLRPSRDFWYPYGNLLLFSAGVIGPMLEWSLDAALIAVIGLTLRNLAGGRRLPVVLGTGLVAIVQLSTSGTPRYLFPLAAVMWMASTRRTSGAQRWCAVAAVAAAPWLALDVGLYALLGAGAAVVLDELATRGPWRSRVRRILIEVGALAVSVVTLLAVLAVRGQLRGNVDFVLHPAEVTTYTAGITSVATLVGSTPSFVLLGAPLLFLSAAIGSALNRSCRPRPWIAVLGSIGAFSLLVLFKHLVRAGVEPILAVAAAAGVATVLCATAGKIAPRAWHAAAGVLIGALVLMVSTNGLAGSWADALGDAPANVGQAVAGLTWDRDETPWLRVRRDLRAVPQLRSEADAAAAADALRGGGRIFVLGDAQYIYPMVGTKPYWTITVYDSSPLRQQRKVLDLLTEDPPSVVIVDRRDLSFDSAPDALRSPLIYRWVVEHYRPVSSSGPFDLLVARDGAAIDWDYWRGFLGATIDLNRLPAASGHAGLEPCTGTEPCVTYATVDLDPVRVSTERAVQVSGPSGAYTVTFQQQPGEATLHLPLGRLWFWTDQSTVTWPGTGSSAGLHVERYRDAGFLY